MRAILKVDPLAPLSQRSLRERVPIPQALPITLNIGVFLLARAGEEAILFDSLSHNLGPTIKANNVCGRGALNVFAS